MCTQWHMFFAHQAPPAKKVQAALGKIMAPYSDQDDNHCPEVALVIGMKPKKHYYCCSVDVHQNEISSCLDCPQPSIFCVFSIDERAVWTARELEASARQKKQGGGGRGAKKISIFLSLASRPPPPARSRFALASRSLRLLFCVEKSRGCGQSTSCYDQATCRQFFLLGTEHR